MAERYQATEKQSKKSARLAMMELANMLSVPMSLNAVVRLGVPDAIWQSGANQPLTAGEILGRIRPSPPKTSSPALLQRLLRMLVSHGVFNEFFDGDQRRYSLTDVGETLVSGQDGVSFSAYVLQHHQDALVRAWPRLDAAVLDPSGPGAFALANGGVPAYEYYGRDAEANSLMQKAMWGVSVPFMESFVDEYGVTEFTAGSRVRKLVDVGGSTGACLQMIMRRCPSVDAGVNFDLPEVVAEAPPFPGITHVGGDMFKSIPAGDAIFMKWVLTTWTDEECKLILENCYKALPEGGKVIACEPVLPEETDSSQRTRALLEGDIFVMTVYRSEGKERTEKEFKLIGGSAGFPNFRAIYLDHFYTVLEFQK